LIAFVIAALAIGVMVDGVVGGLRSASTAAHTQQAVALARSRLAAAEALVLSGPTPQPSQSGEDAGFHWRVDVAATASATLPMPQQVPQGLSSVAPQATLYAIKVVVSWSLDGAPRQVRLDGAQLRLSGASQAAS
jgi:hypothetical protein